LWSAGCAGALLSLRPSATNALLVEAMSADTSLTGDRPITPITVKFARPILG
jgi:hypothetical protein